MTYKVQDIKEGYEEIGLILDRFCLENECKTCPFQDTSRGTCINVFRLSATASPLKTKTLKIALGLGLIHLKEEPRKGCDYCTKLRLILRNKGFSVYIDAKSLVLDNERERALKYINYCPMCGRKLVKE